MPTFIFEPDRLRQARQLALLTKREVADRCGVTSQAVGQFESGVATPRPEVLGRLASALDVPEAFFSAGRPLQRLDTSETHFESLRATTVKQRSHATAFAEQIWELSYALEEHVLFPDANLPAPESFATDQGLSPAHAARAIRSLWGLGDGPIGHLVSHIETHGVVCALAPATDQAVARIDAYSTRAFGRPLSILTADRADDVLRHRFSAAHELGHLLLHAHEPSGEKSLERQADQFAAELLTPQQAMLEELPKRLDLGTLHGLSERWGVPIRMLIYRSKELGLASESSARRAYIRLHDVQIPPRPIRTLPGEVPSVLRSAFELASTRGLTIPGLAERLGWKPRRVRELLGMEDPRPTLRLVTGS